MNNRNLKTHGLFITGTDTDVGKTYVAAMIAQELVNQGIRVGAYKPACSGSFRDADGQPRWQDVEELTRAIGGGFDTERICPQRFAAPLAPPVAARLEGRSVNPQLLRQGALWWQQRVDLLLIEGVGGLLCPLTEEETVADLASDLGYPLIVVARLGLGTINHTLLTVEAAVHRGLTVAGIILNAATPQKTSCSSQTNPAEIAVRCDCPVLGVLPHKQPDGLLKNGRHVKIDWTKLAGLHALTTRNDG